MKYKSKAQIHFDIADPAGVIFYSDCFKLSHRIIEEFIQHIGINWDQWFNNRNFIIPIRHAEAEYFGPLVAGNTYEAILEILKLSDHSITFSVEFIEDKKPLVSVRSTHVFVHPSKKEKVKVPEDWSDRLKNYVQHKP